MCLNEILADMYAKLNSNRCYVYAVNRACDNGLVSRKDCAACVLICGESCVEVALDAMQILGGNGMIKSHNIY